jgi:HAD superfamily hydrolase (TIGR01509 family)
VRRRIGMGSDKLIPDLIGHYDERVAERKKEIFKRSYLGQLAPTPGARDLVAALGARGAKLAVASSAGADELDALLDAAGVGDLLRTTTSADDAARSKPDPDILAAALKKLGLPAAKCVLVGDSPYDAQAARSAGIAFVGVRCGGWADGDLQPAAGIVHDPADLLRRLDHMM